MIGRNRPYTAGQATPCHSFEHLSEPFSILALAAVNGYHFIYHYAYHYPIKSVRISEGLGTKDKTKPPQNGGFVRAAGLGFEPRLTDPLESVVLPLRQPILYEKVF